MKYEQMVNRIKDFFMSSAKLFFKVFVTSNISEINRPPSLRNHFSKWVVWFGEITEDKSFSILFGNALEINLASVLKRDIGLQFLINFSLFFKELNDSLFLKST